MDACSLLQRANAKTIMQLARDGYNSQALNTVAKPIVATSSVRVAGPSTAEERWKAIKAAGNCAGAHFVTVGAKAFNAPEVVGPAAERVAEKQQALRDKQFQNSLEYKAMHTEVGKLLQSMVNSDGNYEWEVETPANLKLLVTFVHKVKNLSGVSKHCANKDAAIAYLKALESSITELHASHPPIVVAGLAPTPSPEGELLSLPAPRPTLAKSAFQKVSDSLPDGKVPEPPPGWLEAALTPGSETASMLVGRMILYHWPDRLGGWLCGEVTAINTDKDNSIQGKMCNYEVYYEADENTATHLLTIGQYATSSKAKIDSWVLLG